MQTRNGQAIAHTGYDGAPWYVSADGKSRCSAEAAIFVRVQILPPVPQRFELVRKENIRGDE
jgi:hypothetical protein